MREKTKLKGSEEIALLERRKGLQSCENGEYVTFYAQHLQKSGLKWTVSSKVDARGRKQTVFRAKQDSLWSKWPVNCMKVDGSDGEKCTVYKCPNSNPILSPKTLPPVPYH